MATDKPYVIARTAAKHVTVQHKVGRVWRMTSCGYDTRLWSVAYMAERINVIACRRPGCREES